MRRKKLKYEDKEMVEKIIEAYNKGHIKVCPKCRSFNVYPYVDEDYFSNMQRMGCRDCKHSWGCGD